MAFQDVDFTHGRTARGQYKVVTVHGLGEEEGGEDGGYGREHEPVLSNPHAALNRARVHAVTSRLPPVTSAESTTIPTRPVATFATVDSSAATLQVPNVSTRPTGSPCTRANLPRLS